MSPRLVSPTCRHGSHRGDTLSYPRTLSTLSGRHRFLSFSHRRACSSAQECCDATIVIPNQNLFRLADKNTSLVDAFKLADDVLYSGVNSVTQLITTPGLVNLDFADVRAATTHTAATPLRPLSPPRPSFPLSWPACLVLSRPSLTRCARCCAGWARR